MAKGANKFGPLCLAVLLFLLLLRVDHFMDNSRLMCLDLSSQALDPLDEDVRPSAVAGRVLPPPGAAVGAQGPIHLPTGA